MLRGLFEVRPALRLGARNVGALRSHPWLRERGVGEWAALETKTLSPFFRPGKRFIKEGFEPFEPCHERRLDEATLLFPTSSSSTGSFAMPAHSLSEEFQQQFRDFHFIAPMHRATFASKVEDTHSPPIASTQSAAAEANEAAKAQRLASKVSLPPALGSHNPPAASHSQSPPLPQAVAVTAAARSSSPSRGQQQPGKAFKLPRTPEKASGGGMSSSCCSPFKYIVGSGKK
jgi:hypothetical protein